MIIYYMLASFILSLIFIETYTMEERLFGFAETYIPDARSEPLRVTDVFHAILDEQESAGAFATFTSIISSHYGLSWRSVIPFLQLSIDLSSQGQGIAPSLVKLGDFLTVGKPYFHSYDNFGRPFIAFVYKQKTTLIIKTIFFSFQTHTATQVHLKDFEALAHLFTKGESEIDFGNGKVVCTLACLPDIEKALQK